MIKAPENILTGRILVSTREEGRSYELKKCLEDHGATVIEFPMITTRQRLLNETEERYVRRVSSFDWLVITSPSAATHFQEAYERLSGKSRMPLELRLAAIGDKTAEVLKGYGHYPAFVGLKQQGEEFAKELKTVFRGKNPKVLWPTSDIARDTFSNELSKSAEVTRVNLYETTAPDVFDQEKVEMIVKDDYSVLLFFSPSAVNNFIDLFKDKMDLSTIRAASLGGVTADACEKAGFEILFIADLASGKSMCSQVFDFVKENS